MSPDGAHCRGFVDSCAGADRRRASRCSGYNRLKDAGKASPAELGQVLLGELNCAQCHAASDAKKILTKGAPDLSDAGADDAAVPAGYTF